MSDANPNEGKPAGGAPEGDDPGKLRSTFEAQKAADDAEIARLKTENLAVRALPGVDVTKPNVASFISGYKGEMTPEAIVKAAEDWDIKPGAAAAPTGDEPKAGDPPDPKATKPASGPTPEERAAAAAAAKVGGASTAPTGDDPDPYKVGTEGFAKAMAEGQDREAAFEAFLAPVIDAGAKGNAAVILAGGRVGGD